ncbi:MAG TPA: SUMF1/EgtB/PvdO family nonheme iron enzyme [Chitinophagaceae bacterium]|nr:SUMF1/EgtB/PvdO family nonheme iron enzyme [Chitinophagaceae bacterium]
MKSYWLQIIALGLVVGVLSGCGNNNGYQGQVTGVQGREGYESVQPYGMVYIPSGNFIMGGSGEDLKSTFTARPKSVTVQGFYMDAGEVTNNQYRQFVYWVRDSIARELMGYVKDNPDGTQSIDWNQEINYNDPATMEQMNALYYTPEDRIWGKMEIDKSKLIYHSEWYDLKAAAMDRGKHPRSSFIRKEDTPIYPDTLSWVRDYSYSYNEPMSKYYFSHPAFDNYPVVGVNWKQAVAFTRWRTKLWAGYRASQGKPSQGSFRLPTEAEWEYAARGGRNEAPYPWGGPYLRNKKGCFLANFKPGRGDYAADGALYPVKVDSYWPNDYGLYNMSGNVAEWTSSAYFESGYHFALDFNPDIQINAKDSAAPKMKRKVVRGGSWKDVGWFLKVGTRSYEYQDSAKCYIGFRTVLSFLGRSPEDFN